MKPIVISETVEHDLCIGCGVCAAICPDGILEMRFNRFGEYNPFEIGDCTKECGLCVKVCPFANGNPDEDAIGRLLFGEIGEIQHRPEIGYFLDAFVGHSMVDAHRERGSSGGTATWLLQTLLEEGAVDAVVCVTSNPDPEKLFRFAVFATVGEVRRASGSAYYPVELSEVFRYIIEHPGRYAELIGLPCFVKAIRLAQLRNRNLRERVVVVLGLVCGQLKSKHYTSYLATLAGLASAPARAHFRGKDPDQPPGNFYFSCRDQNCDGRRIYWNDGVSEAWANRWFTPIACNYCDDIFAECADVTFMDAWLQEYTGDPKGTNLVVVRSPGVLKTLRSGIRSGSVEACTIPIDEVVRSQAGVVVVKRDQLADRLNRERLTGDGRTNKRVTMNPLRNPILRREIMLKEKMQRASRDYSATAYRNDIFDGMTVRKAMGKDLVMVRLLQRISAGVVLPVHGFRYLRRYIHGR